MPDWAWWWIGIASIAILIGVLGSMWTIHQDKTAAEKVDVELPTERNWTIRGLLDDEGPCEVTVEITPVYVDEVDYGRHAAGTVKFRVGYEARHLLQAAIR